MRLFFFRIEIMDRVQLLKIIEAGIHAPSGENCQPWRFEVRGDGELALYNIPERDDSLYSWGQRASYFAHGALLENIRIAASHYGFDMRSQLFPEGHESNLVALIQFTSREAGAEPLFESIFKRTTNRKPYKKVDITDETKKWLTDGVDDSVKIILTTDRGAIKTVANAAASNERVIFENKLMHGFFFNHINWTKAEDDKKSIGFYIDTLELPPPVKVLFKLFRRWPVMRVLGMVGFPRFVALGNGQLYASGSLVGAIVIDDETPEHFVRAGMVAEHIWLNTTKLGLSFQPLAGLIYLFLRVKHGDLAAFEHKHIHLMQKGYLDIQKTLHIENKTIAFMFRIGDGGEPTARATRLHTASFVSYQTS